MLEFIRHGKTNLTYLPQPGVDHWLNEIVLVDFRRDHIPKRQEVFDDIAAWISED